MPTPLPLQCNNGHWLYEFKIKKLVKNIYKKRNVHQFIRDIQHFISIGYFARNGFNGEFNIDASFFLLLLHSIKFCSVLLIHSLLHKSNLSQFSYLTLINWYCYSEFKLSPFCHLLNLSNQTSFYVLNLLFAFLFFFYILSIKWLCVTN